MNKILIVNGTSYGLPVESLGDLSYKVSDFFDNPHEYKLVLFTGGSDVSPEYYGHTSPKNMCHSWPERDALEAQIFKVAIEHNIKMTGICRGAQFINVMSGGTMMHHIDNHASVTGHQMTTLSGRELYVNSLHHQMIVPGDDGVVLGWSKNNQSKRYFGDKDEMVEYHGKEVEVIYYPQTLCVGVQYHPEMMNKDSDGFNYYKDLVDDFLNMTIEDFTDKHVCKTRSISE